MRASVLLFVVAACGSSPPVVVPPPAPPPRPAVAAKETPSPDPTPAPLLIIDWKAVKLESDEDALALWQRIAPTGADWTLRLGELPDDDDLLRRLALALLRSGGFSCPARSACSDAGLREVAPDATFSDPCLRRELALWAFDRLDEEDAGALGEALVAIAGLPPPEEELVSEAFDLVPGGQDALLLRMNAAARAAGQREAADLSLRWLSPAGLVEAARAMHADGAYELLDVAEARELFLFAVADTALAPATRIEAMNALAQETPLRKDVLRAVVKATADARCEVAGAAARLLDEAGMSRYRPRPSRGSISAAIRGLCVAHAYSQAHSGVDDLLQPFVSRDGLAVIDHSAVAEDGASLVGDLMPRDQVLALPFLDEFGEALEHCKGTTCKARGIRFELAFDAARLLRRIDRFDETPPCEDLVDP